MLIQILGLRKFVPKDSKDGKEKTYDAFHEKYWRAKSVPDLFKNIDKVLEKIPEKDRWNLFYTLAHCKEGKREFESLGVIAFDLDGCETKRQDEYIQTVLSVLNVPSDSVAVVSSGHGFHFIVDTKKPLCASKEDFKILKPHYKSVCVQINKALHEAGLPGSTDTTIFEPRRLLRLPKTINRKPGKPEVTAQLVQGKMKPVDFDLKALSGLPDVGEKDQLNTKVLAKFPRCDSQAIMDGCEFIKNFRDNPNSMSEGQWYAALSITGRMNDESDKDGYEWSHELSKGYKGYDPDETDEKLEQALDASGPRTCENINGLWDGCKSCAFKGKVSSPILIRGANSIPTEHTGFHNQPFTGKGKPTPNYQDLRTYFDRHHPYKGLAGSGMVHIWQEGYYKYYERLCLEEFAQNHFDPPAKSNMTKEFSSLITRTNLMPVDWWSETTRRRINFKNGYLDIRSMNFMPHDAGLGFRYALPYEYLPTATAPTFIKMLDMITEGNKAKKDVLLEYMGYCLSNDDCWTQKAMLLVGDGANGKSTLLNTLGELAGDGNHVNFSMKLLNDSEYNRQALDGKLFNVSDETPTKAMAENSLFKSLVTGDKIQVRSPYKDPYFIKNSAKLIFSANELPGSTDTSYGFWRRLIVVPLNATFTKESEGYDPHINLKLSKELPGIFNMVMEGYKRLVKNQKFTDCKEVSEALKDYQLENDSVLRYFNESITVHTNGGFGEHFSPVKDLYLNYKNQTESEGVRPVTMQKFSKTLAKLVPGYGTRSTVDTVAGKKMRGLQGVSFEKYS